MLRNKTILVDAWDTFVTGNGIFQEMKSLLDKFSNEKIILTNANNEERERLGIVNMPYEVYSLAHNPDKTDPEYYKRMLNHEMNGTIKKRDTTYPITVEVPTPEGEVKYLN